jgi:hypothetical protein
MTSTSPSVSGFTPFHSSSTLGEFQRFTEVKTLDAGSSTTTDLTVLTADGDRVTLSQKSTANVAYADYNYLSRRGGQATSYREQSFEVDLQSQFQVAVEGDLNQQERADLERLVKKIEKVVRKFLKGDVEGALAKALQIKNLGSLSSVDLSVEHTESLTVARRQTVQVSDSAASEEADDPAPTSVADLIRQIVKAVKDSGIESRKLQTRLPASIANLFRTLDLGHPDHFLKQVFAELPPS